MGLFDFLFGPKYDRDGYDVFGYDCEGYDRAGFNANGKDREGYDFNGYKDGFNRNGYDRAGYDLEGYNREGYNREGYDRAGFNIYGYDLEGYDRAGFNINGKDREGYDRAGFNINGKDREGYDRAGFNINGKDREGYDVNGYKDGFNRNGYDRVGYNREGYNSEGYNREGYNRAGFNINGKDRDGYDFYGYKDGFNRNGYDRNGYDRDGYDRDGYNRAGFNINGKNRDGYDILDYNKNGLNSMGCDRAVHAKNEYIHSDHINGKNISENSKDNALPKSDHVKAIQICLASPTQIRSWSYGEVKKPETINYRTLKPERDGLFCEKIFGPTKDWECYCGRYKRIRHKDKICERCGVEVTRAKVRRERMGHIELAAPVSHIWYFEGTSSRMGLLLDMSPRLLEKVLYFAAYIVINPGSTNLKKFQLLSEKEYRDHREDYEDEFDAGMGAEAIKKLIEGLDLDELSIKIKQDLETATGYYRAKLLKRLEVVEAFRMSDNKPEWMILDVLPVIPPDIRPMERLDGGRFATHDLNDLYRRVINRNNRLKKLLELGHPDIIVRNEKRMLQEAVDALIYNGRRGRPVTGPDNRPLKYLSYILENKQGRFRKNLLGKRVDYSGCSVIVVGPELKMHQCGLPKEMALELFKPFVMKHLFDQKVATNINNARKMVERASVKEVWDSLEVVIKDHPVLLNRAYTLHRLGIQAFEPVLVDGKAIKLNPLVFTAYNSDLNGDQMVVHVPLSAESQTEARFLMLAANNLLNPSNGHAVTVPTQDIVLGSYYLTMIRHSDTGAGKVFRDSDEALMAYSEHIVTLHAPIKVRRTLEIDGEMRSKIVETTVGRIIFNNPIPQDLGYVDRSGYDNKFILEVEFIVNKRSLGDIIERCIRKHGIATTSELLDQIKVLGHKYSTKSGITFSMSDAMIPFEKPQYSEKAVASLNKIRTRYDLDCISDWVHHERIIGACFSADATINNLLRKYYNEDSSIFIMTDSGAGGSMNQIRQLTGMYELVPNAAGYSVELPIKVNYCEGMTALSYFCSSSYNRKNLTNLALNVPETRDLTRRLICASQDVMICDEDCGTHEGIVVAAIVYNGHELESLRERLVGRYVTDDVIKPFTGEILITRDRMITFDDAERMIKSGIKEVKIRAVMCCESRKGVCSRCYGSNLANCKPVGIGEAVGIIAAQSIGETNTRLTMRTSFTDGIITANDITQGLLRIEELFEARNPRNAAIISHVSGYVSYAKDNKGDHFVMVTDPQTGETFERQMIYGSTLRYAEGDYVQKGELLTEGYAQPSEILAVSGDLAVQEYIIKEVQRLYRTQGVDINDKHIEVIVRQMMRKVKINDQGDTSLIPGTHMEKSDFLRAVADLEHLNEKDGENRKPATALPVLLGITKASLVTESFMAAASFQETTRVLTDAAIKGKVDPLLGLRENAIIGSLIPAGTGTVSYDDVNTENDF